MHIPGGRRQARRGTGGRRCHVQPLDLTRSAARSVFPKHVPLGRGRVAPFSRFCRFPAAQCRSRLFLRRPSCLHAGAHASEHVQATSCLLSGHVSSRISRCGAPVGRGASVPRRCFLCIARCLRDFASCLLEGRAGEAGRQPAVVTGVCARRTLRRGILGADGARCCAQNGRRWGACWRYHGCAGLAGQQERRIQVGALRSWRAMTAAPQLRRADGGPLSLCACTLLLPPVARNKLFVALIENVARPRCKARPRSRAGYPPWHAPGHVDCGYGAQEARASVATPLAAP